MQKKPYHVVCVMLETKDHEQNKENTSFCLGGQGSHHTAEEIKADSQGTERSCLSIWSNAFRSGRGHDLCEWREELERIARASGTESLKCHLREQTFCPVQWEATRRFLADERERGLGLGAMDALLYFPL